VKPLAIAALPFLAFWILRDHIPRLSDPSARDESIRTLARCVAIPLIVLVVLITPFFKLEPWRLVGELEDATQTCNYRVNSFWAYNFWTTGGLFEMGFRPDTTDVCEGVDSSGATDFLGIETVWWGRVMFLVSLGLIIGALWRARGTGFLALGVALSTFAFYLFLTRMHERYVFPAFLPLLLACVLLQSRVLWGVFAAAVVAHFLNLYHVFGYYYFFSPNESSKYPDFVRVDFLYRWIERSDSFGFSLPIVGTLETVQVLAITLVVAFVTLLSSAYILSERQRARATAPQ
jgi:hypothetical protein